MMSDEEFRALKADIKEHGQCEMIVLFEGRILDGRNRYRACVELGIEPDVCEIDDPKYCPDPIAYVVSHNLHRRHLTREQRADIMRQMRAEGNTLQQIADTVGVDVSTAQRNTEGVFANAKTVTGKDGKQYPATKPRTPKLKAAEEQDVDDDVPVLKLAIPDDTYLSTGERQYKHPREWTSKARRNAATWLRSIDSGINRKLGCDAGRAISAALMRLAREINEIDAEAAQ
jgi:hypothetical protein